MARIIVRWGVAALALLGAMAGGAAAQTATAAQNTTPSAAPPAATSAPAPIAAVDDYRLGAGDLVRVNVFQNPELTLEVRLSESGVMNYPLLGAVRIGGRSVAEAERVIADGLRSGNFVRQPQVTITLLQMRGHQVSVLGQVNRPGRYPLESVGMRLSELLATAGGVAATGADVAVLTGVRDGRPYRVVVDVPSLFGTAERAADLQVHNGDVVFVDRQPLVFIYGEVQRPGMMRLERGMTLIQALAAGGGLNARGTERGIRVHRRSAEGKITVLQPPMDERLQDGDVVYVRESLF